MDEQMIEPCRECKAVCRIEVFGPNPAIERPVSLWMCSNHKSFGGDCPSDIAFFDATAWNATHGAGKIADLVEALEQCRLKSDEPTTIELIVDAALAPHPKGME